VVTPCADYAPDEGLWYDPLGEAYGCEWYASDDGEHCGEFASVQNPNFGRTANEACCVCGGGVPYTETGTSTWTTTTECFDWQPSPQEDWYDGKGNTCKYYERELLVSSTCTESENFGMTADQACCACGGGEGRTATGTSSTRTSGTTLSATTFTQTALPTGFVASSAEETSASSLSFALILGLIAAGLLAAWIAGLMFLKVGCGYRARAARTHPTASAKGGHDPPRAPGRHPPGAAVPEPSPARQWLGREDIIVDMDSPVV